MKLLIITQKVDKNDSLLGFFHKWIKEFRKHSEKITVICLEKGKVELGENSLPRSENSAEFSTTGVNVLSLGKEERVSRLSYILRFYKYIWQERQNYDLVFVHMNQEYVLLGGLLWKILGKKVTMWRNHEKGSFLTAVAVALADKVFCTSKKSFTARYKKTIIMPVGIDTRVFSRDYNIVREKGSILFLSRISPVKRLDLLIQALNILDKENIRFKLSVYGNAPERDKSYYQIIREESKELEKKDKMIFHEGISNIETPKIYNGHEIFINATEGGSFDKTILEALACGALGVISNKDVTNMIPKEFLFKEGDFNDLADKIKYALSLSENEKEKIRQIESTHVSEHDLSNLSSKLFQEFAKLEKN